MLARTVQVLEEISLALFMGMGATCVICTLNQAPVRCVLIQKN